VSIVVDVVEEFLTKELSRIVEDISNEFSHTMEFVASVSVSIESFICEFVELELVKLEL
jgi:hypothetical protein